MRILLLALATCLVLAPVALPVAAADDRGECISQRNGSTSITIRNCTPAQDIDPPSPCDVGLC